MAGADPPGEKIAVHSPQGTCPGGVVAYSNGDDMSFTHEENLYDHLFIGWKWQCVEFARRWLLLRKGLLLPEVDFAAHLIYLTYAVDPQTGEQVPMRAVFNHGMEKPVEDALIIYGERIDNFVGHVGVIVEVGDNYVRIADQNRYFHKWDAHYSMEFPLVHHPDGSWEIVDDHAHCVGWLTFPGRPNRPVGSPAPKIPENIKQLPQVGVRTRLKFMGRTFWNFPLRDKAKFLAMFSVAVVKFTTRAIFRGVLRLFGLRKPATEEAAKKTE